MEAQVLAEGDVHLPQMKSASTAPGDDELEVDIENDDEEDDEDESDNGELNESEEETEYLPSAARGDKKRSVVNDERNKPDVPRNTYATIFFFSFEKISVFSNI